METKKFMSYERLAEYDALIKTKIDDGDESTLSSAKDYTDEKIAAIPSVDAYTKSEIDTALLGKSDTFHTHNWNDLKDKPVILESSDTLTWNGDISGRVCIDMPDGVYMVHVSDSVPTMDEFANGGNVIYTNLYHMENLSISFVAGELMEQDGVIYYQYGTFLIIPDDNMEIDDLLFPKKGLYVLWTDPKTEDGMYVSELRINGYKGFIRDVIDPAYMPIKQPNWDQNDESAPDAIRNRPFGVIPSSSDTLTWDGNIEGKAVVNDDYYFVADTVLTDDDFVDGITFTVSDGIKSMTIENAEHTWLTENHISAILYNGGIACLSISSLAANSDGVPAGIYFLKKGDIALVSLTIPGRTVFPTLKKLDAKYLPDTVLTKADLEAVATKADLEAAIGAAIGGSY